MSLSKTLNLLFPCCHSETARVKSEDQIVVCLQSPITHLIYALVVGIIAGAGMAGIFYSVPQGAIAMHGVAIAGGSFALFMGIFAYTLLRCVLGKVPEKQ